MGLVASAALGGVLSAQSPATPTAAAPPVKHWPAQELQSGATRLLLSTPTHLFKLIRLDQSAQAVAESHEGTSDIFFVEAGEGSVLVGGEIEGGAALPGMPGEMRGPSLRGAKSYELKPGAMINIPPSTPYMLQKPANNLSLVQLRVNVGMHPWSIVQTQQTVLPVTPTRPRVSVPLNSEQGSVAFWSAESMRQAHETLSKTAAAGGSVSDPRDLIPVPATRTHAYNFMHRIMGANGRPPGVEFHEGNTDIYFIIGGSGTLMTVGEIENREPVPNRPGEYRGTVIKNGKGYALKTGDVLNMPPSVSHQSLPDPGGFTYMLIKVNTGTYPWSLTEK